MLSRYFEIPMIPDEADDDRIVFFPDNGCGMSLRDKAFLNVFQPAFASKFHQKPLRIRYRIQLACNIAKVHPKILFAGGAICEDPALDFANGDAE